MKYVRNDGFEVAICSVLITVDKPFKGITDIYDNFSVAFYFVAIRHRLDMFSNGVRF